MTKAALIPARDGLDDARQQGVAKAPATAPRFVEKDLQAAIRALLAQKKTDVATKTLVDMLGLIETSNVNIKEKLNNILFLARAIQDAGGSKYGHVKLRSKIKTLAGFLKGIDLPPGGFVELGCGAHDPVSMSTYFYVNGMTPAAGVDLLSPRADYFSALSMYDILANMKMFPGRYAWAGNKPQTVLAGLRSIDAAAFERGDFDGGLASMDGNVRLISEDFLTCDLATGSLSLLTSFAVLEHVDDIDAIARRCFELLVPGGIAYHFVDLADHRSYRGDGAFGPLTFLTEEHAPANMNRLRAPEITEAMVAAGFELIKDQRIGTPMSSKTKAGLVSRFAAMPEESVAVIKQHLVLRKPDASR